MLNVIRLKISHFFKKNIAQWTSFLHLYFQQITAENAGNRISEVLDFKIFRGGCHRTPLFFTCSKTSIGHEKCCIRPWWYTIINPVFSDTNGNLQVASKAMDVLSDDSDSEISNNEDTESADIDEGQDADESDLAKANDSGNDCDKQKRLVRK